MGDDLGFEESFSLELKYEKSVDDEPEGWTFFDGLGSGGAGS